MNMFVSSLTKMNTVTQNGALSNSSTGDSILDYFAKCGSYRNRPQALVNADMASIFGTDNSLALRCVLYNRMITRKPVGVEVEEVQKGMGNKDEFIKSLVWLELNRPELLYNNIHLIPIISRWSDLWYDSQVTKLNHYVNTDYVYPLVLSAMADKTKSALLAKYLPKLRSTSNTKNDRHRRINTWVRGLLVAGGISERDYRKFKSSPENTAHQFQRLMCSGKWDKLNFNHIPGKALMKFVKGKAITKHGLTDSYTKWIQSKPVAKFTGYPYELYKSASVYGRTLVQKYTYDAQFKGLVELAQKSVPEEILNGGVLCALDTSGSMTSGYGMKDFAPIDVCIGLGLYFSSLLKGEFSDTVVMFDSTSRILKLNGGFCDRVDQIKTQATAWGSTNFDSVIEEIIRVRKQNPNIPVEDFPKYLLVVSDMQFNPVAGNAETNYQSATRKLAAVGLPPMNFIWWNCNGAYGGDQPSTINDAGTTLISGFDGAILTTLLGGQEKIMNDKGEMVKPSPYDQMVKVLSQQIFDHIKV
jgi:hypothetical protein